MPYVQKQIDHRVEEAKKVFSLLSPDQRKAVLSDYCSGCWLPLFVCHHRMVVSYTNVIPDVLPHVCLVCKIPAGCCSGHCENDE